MLSNKIISYKIVYEFLFLCDFEVAKCSFGIDIIILKNYIVKDYISKKIYNCFHIYNILILYLNFIVF